MVNIRKEARYFFLNLQNKKKAKFYTKKKRNSTKDIFIK